MTYREFQALEAAILHSAAEKDEQTEKTLTEEGLLSDGRITEKGLLAMEPYRVKRAVFLAAGFGSRMVPITLNTPKPMVRVHGKRIIETLLDAVLAAGIEEIVIVRGYLGEEFDLLLKKYPMIRFIENPDYANSGTIASVYHARHFLENAYLLESDLVVKNPAVIRKYHYGSDYLGTPVSETDDWFLHEGADGFIDEVGVGCHGEKYSKLIGISYWNEADGKQIAEDVNEVFHRENGNRAYWSHVPFRYYRDHYRVRISTCGPDDVTEIDSFSELQEVDPSYRVQ